MGAHRTNPMALAAAERAIIQNVTEFGYAYAFEVDIEPNKAKMAEITAMFDTAKEAGRSPDELDMSDAGLGITPECQDYVVYHRIRQVRKILVTGQTATINIRGPEHFRMPLTEVMNRAQLAVDGGPSENKA